jgi:3-hydroxyisobutyrate dehydrogenase
VAATVGGTPASTLGELGDATVVVCLLPNTDAVEDVVCRDDGLLATLRRGSLIVDMGSSDPRRTTIFAKRAGAAGIDYADAPVSGGVRRARTGELTVMFGGSAAQLARARPVLDAVGTTVIHVGRVGSAHAMKALNNLLSAINLAGALEVIEVGRRFGIDARTMLDTLNVSTGQNSATLTKVDRVLDGTMDSGFALRLMLKDVATAVAIARDVAASTPLGDACASVWRSAATELPADADQLELASVVWPSRAAAAAASERDPAPLP